MGELGKETERRVEEQALTRQNTLNECKLVSHWLWVNLLTVGPVCDPLLTTTGTCCANC